LGVGGTSASGWGACAPAGNPSRLGDLCASRPSYPANERDPAEGCNVPQRFKLATNFCKMSTAKYLYKLRLNETAACELGVLTRQSQPIADCIRCSLSHKRVLLESQLFHCGCWAASLASRTRFPSFDQGNLAARNVSGSFFTSTRRKSRAECCLLLRPVWRCPDGGRSPRALTDRPDHSWGGGLVRRQTGRSDALCPRRRRAAPGPGLALRRDGQSDAPSPRRRRAAPGPGLALRRDG